MVLFGIFTSRGEDIIFNTHQGERVRVVYRNHSGEYTIRDMLRAVDCEGDLLWVDLTDGESYMDSDRFCYDTSIYKRVSVGRY